MDCPLLTTPPAGTPPPDVWGQPAGQRPSEVHATDPQMGCADINIWASGVPDPSCHYTIDGWPPTCAGRLAYASTWHYDTTLGGTQLISVISVSKLIAQAVANGNRPQPNLGSTSRSSPWRLLSTTRPSGWTARGLLRHRPGSVGESCTSWSALPDTTISPTDTAGGSVLQYDSTTSTYTYVWKTSKTWSGTCRQLQVALNDGTTHTADFEFK